MIPPDGVVSDVTAGEVEDEHEHENEDEDEHEHEDEHEAGRVAESRSRRP